MIAKEYCGGILVMPATGIGWHVKPGDPGWAWAQSILKERRK